MDLHAGHIRATVTAVSTSWACRIRHGHIACQIDFWLKNLILESSLKVIGDSHHPKHTLPSGASSRIIIPLPCLMRPQPFELMRKFTHRNEDRKLDKSSIQSFAAKRPHKEPISWNPLDVSLECAFIFQYLYSAFLRDPKRFYLNYMTRLTAIVKLYTRYD